MSNFGIMSRCDAVIDHIINVGHSDLYLRSSDFLHILKSVSWMKIILWKYESVDQMINLGHGDPYFRVQ